MEADPQHQKILYYLIYIQVYLVKFFYQKYFELNARRGAANYIDRTEVRDKYTFVVKLKMPYGGFLSTWGPASSFSAIHCKKAIEDGDLERINSAAQTLTEASHKLAESIYGQPGSPGDGAGSEAGGADDDVIDAEYVDVEDEKKE